jgi:hypothetical protein
MTIVASVKVRDGLVLGTDSMTQLTVRLPTGEVRFAKAYTNARKLFDLSPARAGVMSWGLGNIGDHSIEGLVREFRSGLDDNATIEDIAKALFAFIAPRWNAVAGVADDPNGLAIGFCVAGYSPSVAFAEVYEFVLPRDVTPAVSSGPDDFGLLWRGIDTPLIRLIKGVDNQLIEALAREGLTHDRINELIEPLEWFLYQPGMPLQDAVNLVDYLLSTTVGVSSFVEPNPTCGGPLQVAAVLPDRGFAWISRTPLSVQSQDTMQ